MDGLGGTNIDIVLQFDPARTVEVDIFQDLADGVIGLSFGLLGGLDGHGLVQVAPIIDIQLAKGVLKSEDFALLELGVLPAHGEHRQLAIAAAREEL